MVAITQFTAEPFRDLTEWHEWFTDNLDRHDTARAAAIAIHNCAPADRIPVLEFLTDFYSAGAPIPAFGSVMAEASDWAAYARPVEHKAYCLACFNRLSVRDQNAFLAYVQERSAA